MNVKHMAQYLPVIFILFASIGCEPDNSTALKGKLEFSISAPDKGLSSGRVASDTLRFVLVTIEDKEGNKIYNREKLDLYSFSGNYLSEPIDLYSGAYSLTEFFVVNSHGDVAYATPLEGSDLAHLVEDPLPIDFTITRDQTTKVTPQVVAVDAFNTAEDFGYTTFAFDIVETLSFQVAVFAYDYTTENFELTTSTLRVFGDSTTNLYAHAIPDSTTRVTVKDGFSHYTLQVLKDGYAPFKETFTAAELQHYTTGHVLTIKLTATTSINRCLQFDGVDDYIDLGNIYDSLTFPFSVSAWVNIDPNVPYMFPILTSQDNLPLYNGFWFCVTKERVFVEYGDGLGQNHPAYRKGKSAYVSADITGKWIYIAATVRGAYDMDVYVNGVNVGGEWTGDSSYPMASNFPEDMAKIGIVHSNDFVAIYKGLMDDVSVWNRSLSGNEVNAFMHHTFTGSENGLIGHWNFNEADGDAIYDKSVFHYNGTAKGDITRTVSTIPGH